MDTPRLERVPDDAPPSRITLKLIRGCYAADLFRLPPQERATVAKLRRYRLAQREGGAA